MVNVESGEEDELCVQSVRVAYGVASRYLSAASIRHPPLAEGRGDGIVRD